MWSSYAKPPRPYPLEETVMFILKLLLMDPGELGNSLSSFQHGKGSILAKIELLCVKLPILWLPRLFYSCSQGINNTMANCTSCMKLANIIICVGIQPSPIVCVQVWALVVPLWNRWWSVPVGLLGWTNGAIAKPLWWTRCQCWRGASSRSWSALRGWSVALTGRLGASSLSSVGISCSFHLSLAMGSLRPSTASRWWHV